MKKFITKILVVSVTFPVIVLLLVIMSSTFVDNQKFNNGNTESNLLFIEKDTTYDIALMGISHARNFSRHGNHARIEKYGKSVINIGKGEGTCGVNEQLFYLKYIYSKHITADTVIYILSPPMLFNEDLNITSNTFDNEPINLDFIFQYLSFPSQNKYQRILSYFSSKLKPGWILTCPFSLAQMNDKLSKIDTSIIAEGFKKAYTNGLDKDIFRKNCMAVEQTINMAQSNGSVFIFIIPPALFGKWISHNQTIMFCTQMQQKYNVEFYDFSETILLPKYYYDHHHLNTDGIDYFNQNYFKGIIKGKY